MNSAANSFQGKIAYALLFVAVLPAWLAFWAMRVAHAVTLPAVHAAGWGLAMVGAGLVLLLGGMYALWHYGKGLPMNAYPPPVFVRESVFRLLPHPIYTGFVLMCFGTSLYFGNAAGFWLVSPVVLAGCVALVWGYERPDLLRRFPDAPREYRIAVPPAGEESPALWHRFSVYVALLLPWVLLSAAAFTVDAASAGRESFFQPFDIDLSPASKRVISAVAVLWVASAPLFARTRGLLRQFFLGGLVGGAVVLVQMFVLPVVGMAHASTVVGDFWVQVVCSLSWFWVLWAAVLYGKSFHAARVVIYSVAGLLTFGVIAVSSDPVLHVFSGAIGFVLALFYRQVWEFLREQAEIVANSWKEWIFGPVRVINHGFYVGAAAFLGIVIGGYLSGDAYVTGVIVFGVTTVICGGLWGQLVEGSDKLKRPFGFYGFVLGTLVSWPILYWMGINVWVVLATGAVFLPWVQAIGRLRCLINGCCHGAVSPPWIGIRYVHPRSRVCFLAGLKGKPLHPTQLYSMLWLSLVGGIQARLWQSGAELSFLIGTYFILNGLGRFVEEAYRGEPQTPVFGKLRLYQWAAIVTILAGMVITTFPYPMPDLAPVVTWRTFAWAAFMGFFVQFMMGIDFPQSQRRFSRLT
ncbi:MAG: prolipoprotein diacylglyceryl transferase [Saprospiraceae bacterium]|nr:prolipoprotein diacylglyceryl transferase [Saprospiraceae bacterium]